MPTRVYRVKTTAVPPAGRFPHYAPLVTQSERDENWLQLTDFQGQPFSRRWRVLKLMISMPRLPRPDFHDFGSSVFVCNDRALACAGGPLDMAGELLPVRIKGESGGFHIFNCTNCIDVLNARKSRWRSWGPRHMRLRSLEQPAFVGSRLGEICLFKFPEDAASHIYCIERTADPVDDEFKALVEHHRLTGLEFELVWTGR